MIARLLARLNSPFSRNLGSMGGAQLLIRLSRLVTVLVLTRMLSPQDYGLAAVVLTTYEFVNVFTRSGISARLIQVGDTDLEVLCHTAYWLNWLLCGSLFIIQNAVAFGVGWFYHDSRLVLPICLMSVIYLFHPASLIQSARIQRENRLGVTALGNVLQVSADNLMTALFALCGFGMWAIVLPKILATPIWVLINRRNHPWRPTVPFTVARWREIVAFGRNILAVELLATVRGNLDNLLVGRFLGIDALGLYYFAFNAGLGISLSLVNAFNATLYPHLCAVRGDAQQLRTRYFTGLKTAAMVAVPLVLLQASLAPFYVPLIFGQKWTAAVPVLILVCLSALPRPFADATSQLLKAVGKPEIDLRWNLLFTALLTASLVAALPFGIVGVASAVLIVHAVALPLFVIWVARTLFPQSPLPLVEATS